MKRPEKFIVPLLLAASLGGYAVISLGGCASSSSLSSRHETAAGIASPAGMTENVMQAGMFSLTTWQRLSQAGGPADVYIEGDGLAWLGKNTKSLNPTPPDPLALRLAAADRAANVVYLARPCQYTGWTGGGACPDIYWTTSSTAPEVIAAYRQALDALKAQGITGFNLIGYSGGAAIAVLTAAERQDVLSIRTVAGNTDFSAFAAVHGVTSLRSSTDPASVAGKVAHIPQMHFIGADDAIVPRAVFDGFRQASGSSACVRSQVVAGKSHDKGWAEAWPELLAQTPSCK